MMNKLLNAAALAVVVCGGGILAAPAPASATYINPWTSGGDSGGVTYCCRTGDTYCCYMSGCATKEGTCVRVVPAG